MASHPGKLWLDSLYPAPQPSPPVKALGKLLNCIHFTQPGKRESSTIVLATLMKTMPHLPGSCDHPRSSLLDSPISRIASISAPMKSHPLLNPLGQLWLGVIMLTAVSLSIGAAQAQVDLTPPSGTLLGPGSSLGFRSRGLTVNCAATTAIPGVQWKVNLAVGQTFAARIYDNSTGVLLASGTPTAGTGAQTLHLQVALISHVG